MRFGIHFRIPKVALPVVGQPWAEDASPLAKKGTCHCGLRMVPPDCNPKSKI